MLKYICQSTIHRQITKFSLFFTEITKTLLYCGYLIYILLFSSNRQNKLIHNKNKQIYNLLLYFCMKFYFSSIEWFVLKSDSFSNPILLVFCSFLSFYLSDSFVSSGIDDNLVQPNLINSSECEITSHSSFSRFCFTVSATRVKVRRKLHKQHETLSFENHFSVI